MSIKKVLLVVLAVLVIAVVVAAVVVDNKFGVVMGSPQISHDTLVKPQTRAQLVINVPLAKDIIKTRLLKDINVPDSVLPYAIPYEAGLIVTPDYPLSDLNFALYVNDRRLGPVIQEKLDGIKLPKPFDQWFTGKTQMKERGMLVRDGVAKLDRTLVANLKSAWKDPAPAEALRVDGSHLIELAIDNRDGSGMAIAGLIVANFGQNISDLVSEGRMGIIADIGDARLTADITPENALKVRLTVECTPSTDAASVDIIKMLVDMGLGQIQGQLAKYGDVKTQTSEQGKTVVADITFPDVNAVLNTLM